jgi:chromosome segregation ATPase
VQLALEMMKAGKTPVIDISKLPYLAWPVPQWYFDEIKQDFWEETAKKYSEFTEYFTDLVIEKKQKYIAKRIKTIFINPWDEYSFNKFLEKLKKYSNWKPVSQEKIQELKTLTDEMWVVLSKEIKKLDLAIATNEEITEKYDKILEDLNKQLKEKDEKLRKLRTRKEELRTRKEELRTRKEELEREIKKIKEQIKDRNKVLQQLKKGL